MNEEGILVKTLKQQLLVRKDCASLSDSSLNHPCSHRLHRQNLLKKPQKAWKEANVPAACASV
jgi:hypothetical protein